MKDSALVSSTTTVVNSLADANQAAAQIATIKTNSTSFVSLKKLVDTWKKSIAGSVKNDLVSVNGAANMLKSLQPKIAKEDAKQILKDLKRVKPQMVSFQKAIARSEAKVTNWRDDLAKVGVTLQSEIKAASAQIAAAREEVRRLERAVIEVQRQIKFYEQHPFQVIVDGFNLPKMIARLNELSVLLRGAVQPERIQAIEQGLRDLQVVESSFGVLLSSATAVGGGLAGLSAAVGTTVASLDSMNKAKPEKSLIIAEMKTMKGEFALAAKAVK